jgi:hypothetical protein
LFLAVSFFNLLLLRAPPKGEIVKTRRAKKDDAELDRAVILIDPD